MEQRAIPLKWSRGQNETLTSMEYVITKELVSHILKSNNQIYFNLQETQRSRGQFLFLPLILVMAKLCAAYVLLKMTITSLQLSLGSGFGSLTHCLKSKLLFGSVSCKVSLRRKFLRRGLTEDVHCQICNNGRENVLHVLRDCSYARARGLSGKNSNLF